MMNAPEEEMNTDRIEEYLSILQSRAPVTEEYDSEVQWAKLEEAHPLAFEDSSQLEEMTPSFSARKEKLHHVRHIHMLTRGAGVAALFKYVLIHQEQWNCLIVPQASIIL